MNQTVPSPTENHAWTGTRYIDMLAPRPEDISLWEVATGLSREQRFGGSATTMFWSVGQHTLLVDHLMEEDGIRDRQTRRAALMHDAPEYMLRDMIRPMKRAMPEYVRIEGIWWAAIAQRFDLPAQLPSVVKEYDNLALAVEKKCLISPSCGVWHGVPDAGDRTIPHEILALSPNEAFSEFLRRARDLDVK